MCDRFYLEKTDQFFFIINIINNQNQAKQEEASVQKPINTKRNQNSIDRIGFKFDQQN